VDKPRIQGNWEEMPEEEKDLYCSEYNTWLLEHQRKCGMYVGEPPEEDACPHDEHDHGICLDCGTDITQDLVGKAEFRRDCAEDR